MSASVWSVTLVDEFCVAAPPASSVAPFESVSFIDTVTGFAAPVESPYVPVIAAPAASVGVTVSCVFATEVFAVAGGTPLIASAATMPFSVMVRLALADPATITNVFVAIESACEPAPAPPGASYVVTVKLSLPGGDGGPDTVQPLLHEFPLVPLTLVVTEVFVRPAGGLLSVIVTDNVEGEMYDGLRVPLDAPFCGTTSVNCGVTS
jgi:hypothetical protein